MGLEISVGVLATAGDDEEAASWNERFALLNEVLAEAGLPAHHEPAKPTETFDAQMWGYNGLHTVRRMAAWRALKRGLPSSPGGQDAAYDPLLEDLYRRVDRNWSDRKSLIKKLLGFLNPAGPSYSAFDHLMMHSDCEGFYIPQALDRVVFDRAVPQRPGLGAMIGSSQRLLEECRILARHLELPSTIDPEAEDLWEVAEAPDPNGPIWRRYGVESFSLTRLIRACEVSVRTGAALVFR